jgi:hypothetical protein
MLAVTVSSVASLIAGVLLVRWLLIPTRREARPVPVAEISRRQRVADARSPRPYRRKV